MQGDFDKWFCMDVVVVCKEQETGFSGGKWFWKKGVGGKEVEEFLWDLEFVSMFGVYVFMVEMVCFCVEDVFVEEGLD